MLQRVRMSYASVFIASFLIQLAFGLWLDFYGKKLVLRSYDVNQHMMLTLKHDVET